MGSESSAETVFLGWEEMPLVVATRWLLKHKGSDLSQVVVALPGARSGRLLLDCLAREAGKALRPPEIVTAGALSDFLLELDGTPAGRLSRTLAWARALRTLDARQLRRIVARPPEDDDFSAWWRLAEEVRSLFGEMAAEGLEFSAVASDPTLLDQGVSREGERQRWHALAAAQKEMSKLLAAADLVDPHLGRWQAIENENQAKVSQIVLIGVVEASALLRRAIELSSASCTALVFAPNGLAQTFDNLGCLIASEWSEQSCSCSAEQWKVVDSPADQAQAARDEIAQWQGAFSAEQISIGLGNPEAGPFVKRALSNERIVVRDAAGETLKNSSPARLLVALGRFLDSERFLDFTGLLRHVDYEHCLRSTLGNIDPVATADTYFTKHLPDRINGEWLAKKGDKRDEEVRNKIASVWKSSEALLAGLRGTGKVPTMQAVAGIRTFLETLYDGRSFDLNEDAGRRSFSALEQIGKHLSEIESLPAQFLDDCTIAEALALLERLLQGSYLPPVAAQEGEATIEMLGWLELSLDNAPALVVLGFEDGHVPESVRGDAYLPNSLRKSLGILDDEQRLARDIYASELLVQSRERVTFVTGRRSLTGDPLLPSRIVFHCAKDEVPARARSFVTSERPVRTAIEDDSKKPPLPGSADGFKLEKISVTDFRTYLQSPYEYYLKKIARVSTLDDRARELDGLQFGIVAHEVVERFGRDKKLRDSKDEKAIEKYLTRELQDVGKEFYGQTPLPAIRLQLRHLEYRMASFAKAQAARRCAGWKIHAVEWAPKGESIPFEVDGETVQLRGRIDRIDYHELDKRFAIWDYKTGNSIKRPATAHRGKDGPWKDLQLPLYCWLVGELLGDAMPQSLGYISLCQEPAKIGFDGVGLTNRAGPTRYFGFDSLEEALDDAHDAAKDVIRGIRRGEFFTVAGYNPSQDAPIMRAIGGLDLLEESDEEEATEERA